MLGGRGRVGVDRVAASAGCEMCARIRKNLFARRFDFLFNGDQLTSNPSANWQQWPYRIDYLPVCQENEWKIGF